jgi:hypothetical protein
VLVKLSVMIDEINKNYNIDSAFCIWKFSLWCVPLIKSGSLNWPWSTKILGQFVTRMHKNWLWYWKLRGKSVLVKLSVMIDWLVFNANISSISFCYVQTGKFVWNKSNSLFTISITYLCVSQIWNFSYQKAKLAYQPYWIQKQNEIPVYKSRWKGHWQQLTKCYENTNGSLV